MLGISTDKTLSVNEIEKMVNGAEMTHKAEIAKYGGDWIIPLIARNDQANSNEYWRGRI